MQRFGDPAAPKFHIGTASRVAAWIALPAFAIFIPFLAYAGISKAVKTSSVPLLVGSIVGPAIGILSLVAGIVAWSWLWLPLLWRLRAMRRAAPQALVLAACLTAAAQDGLVRGWPGQSTSIRLPRTMVIMVDNDGISLWSRRRSQVSILKLRWSEIRSVVAAEFVEREMAFERLAIMSPSGEAAIALQLVEAAPTLVRFVSGNRLVTIAAQVEAVRPQ